MVRVVEMAGRRGVWTFVAYRKTRWKENGVNFVSVLGEEG